jgi:hypothetical protein
MQKAENRKHRIECKKLKMGNYAVEEELQRKKCG